jgi:hypothetical protein
VSNSPECVERLSGNFGWALSAGYHGSAERANRRHRERFALQNNARSAPHGEFPDGLEKVNCVKFGFGA